MADNEASSPLPESEDQLWIDLQRAVAVECHEHEAIDDALREWLDLSIRLRAFAAVDSQDEVVTCAQVLEDSSFFQNHRDYIRTQIIHSLLQEDDTAALHAISCLLLLDGETDEEIFARLVGESCFPRLLELINERRDDDPRVKRLILQLMYEMSRIERLREEDLELVDDEFIHYMLRNIEDGATDSGDPYHYPTIRVLVNTDEPKRKESNANNIQLVLNEQYMLASTDTTGAPVLTNRIVKCLSTHGPAFRTFGENIILLLNRETETSLQLLILKLLYLLFTTKATYEYFYTNDLRVLVDVIVRNLMDLPDEKMSLRHTYLRVLYPLLAHTQLNQAPHYKRNEILKVLHILRGSHDAHFAPADETTLRLVDRVGKVKWLASGGAGEAEVAKKFLGISLSRSQTSSSISVSDVAAVKEKPGVQTPSRHTIDGHHVEELENGDEIEVKRKKPLPLVPKHRHGTPVGPPPAVQVNGSFVQAKKVPPKAPPPRRGGRTISRQHSPAQPAIQEVVPETEQEA